ncbi:MULTISPECIES: alpha/beta fold hydrolase [unclassified Streptomyces]|uniref:alpha/beta fold hydrolase n=1 Tax=unclassified Streptomyces TaxID=2593676 RepID=UPI0022588B03|nr:MULTISPECIES: alpha/beta hydrolase [unclassified Streptomyces]MCX5144787.1 alpha/beta hydrolase [Streptomyces sp. NBC_00338]WRZ62951.1 alpha/beta hydrolase [Streptomyces sp. NBC_01257]
MPTFHTYDGTELAYRVLGEGAPLICLPGGAMRAGAYLGDLGGLSATRQLVVLDLRGTGDSAVPDDMSTCRCDRLVEDVEALRLHLGLDRVDLLAHSAAGDLASLYAARHPEALRSLILVAPGTRATGFAFVERAAREAAALRCAEPWYAQALPALEQIWAGHFTDELRAASRPFLYGRWDGAAQEHAARSAREINAAAAQAYYADGAFNPVETVASLRTFPAPVLVLTGEYDGLTTPDRAAELAALFPESEFAVQRGAGHFPWLDDPGAFVRTVTAFLDPEVHSVQAGGIRLAYRVWGEPSAPPVVLAHGRCGDSTTWTEVAERLAAGHRVYAFDFRGHGLSDWTGRYSFELFRDDLHAFLEARNLSGATVVGHSMGGAAAFLLAERQPGLIGRLVLEEAPPPFPLDPPRGPVERPEGRLDFDWPVVPSINAQLNEPDPEGRERLAEITAPTLVIGGGPGSQIVQEDLAWMARQIPGARHVTIDAGHLVHTERPEEFLAALRSFGVG